MTEWFISWIAVGMAGGWFCVFLGWIVRGPYLLKVFSGEGL